MYTGTYKIDQTKDLEHRMKKLDVGVSADLIKAQFFNDCHAIEKRIHKEYAGGGGSHRSTSNHHSRN